MSSDLYKRGLSTAFGHRGTKGATGKMIAGSNDRASAISNIRSSSNDVLPRKQYGIPGTKDWKPFAPHSGNTGLTTIDPSNTSRGYARDRYNTLLAKNKARLGQ